MDVVFEHTAVGGFQSQQVLIPGLGGFQPVLCVLSLPLREGEREGERSRHTNKEGRESKEREK